MTQDTDGTGAVVADTACRRGGQLIKKGLLLFTLCMQNALYTMFRRWSVGVLGERYSSHSVLLVGEAIKLLFSMGMVLFEKEKTVAEGDGLWKLVWLMCNSYSMLVPAIIFWAQNLLSYVSLARIDASTFVVWAQLKVLTTAVFSVLLLNKSLHPRKWRALLLLIIGVILVSDGAYDRSDDTDLTGGTISTRYLIGLLAVLTEVTLSGYASVYFERVLKSRVAAFSVWQRNFQLAVFSLILYSPGAIVSESNFFAGWTIHTVILAIMGAAGGILVALTVKHANAILKTFATSGAIVVCAVGSHFFLGAALNIPIWAGSANVVLSLLNYSDNGDVMGERGVGGKPCVGIGWLCCCWRGKKETEVEEEEVEEEAEGLMMADKPSSAA